MKVITLWQPWAQFVTLGWKTIETRTHNRFAGLKGQEILIHAGLNWDTQAYTEAYPYMHESWLKAFNDPKNPLFDPKKMGGRILASACVADARPLTVEDERQALIECGTKRYGLMLSYVKILNPFITAQGKQGVWNFPFGGR